MVVGILILFSVFTSVYADDEIKILYKLLLDYPDWKPRGIVDVGANIGGWTTKVQDSLPGIPTLMVEASTTHKKELEETKQKFSNVHFCVNTYLRQLFSKISEE